MYLVQGLAPGRAQLAIADGGGGSIKGAWQVADVMGMGQGSHLGGVGEEPAVGMRRSRLWTQGSSLGHAGVRVSQGHGCARAQGKPQ